MTPEIAESIRETAEVLEQLAYEYGSCHTDPELYSQLFGDHKPHGVTWEQWSEEQCAVLASDIAVRIDRLMTLVEPGRSS